MGANETNLAAIDAAHSLDADLGERAFFLLNPAFLPVALLAPPSLRRFAVALSLSLLPLLLSLLALLL